MFLLSKFSHSFFTLAKSVAAVLFLGIQASTFAALTRLSYFDGVWVNKSADSRIFMHQTKSTLELIGNDDLSFFRASCDVSETERRKARCVGNGLMIHDNDVVPFAYTSVLETQADESVKETWALEVQTSNLGVHKINGVTTFNRKIELNLSTPR
jgi:hypothetical protein